LIAPFPPFTFLRLPLSSSATSEISYGSRLYSPAVRTAQALGLSMTEDCDMSLAKDLHLLSKL
jgi:hypothetical protein